MDRVRLLCQLAALTPILAEQGLALGHATVEVSGARPAGPGEEGLVSGMVGARRREFLAGRCAVRRALWAAGSPAAEEILYEGRRPRLPDDFVGSISHSDGLAVALAAARLRFRAVGCDLELRRLPTECAHIVLTGDERAWMQGARTPEEAEWRLLSVFSAKEAAFKAFAVLLGEAAPTTLLGIAARPVRGGFEARPRHLVGGRLKVEVRPCAQGAFSWTAAADL
ncbi:4'-phosphopantetheinyl transferase superfamily protein [Streptomyces sp. NBC_01210]|uniref:4'-phosphopantetheinyl transferase superfamily protein n=1 Tax=Streptomyces sp. NBC_01210 TaxID=2903774 RepID=UPI002E1034B9|nr:4'-phosphopantetheinyl transferase superfamily protein [Streptomyces sp. NBC_01210]